MLAEADHVTDELFPEVEKAPEGVAEVTVAREADDALLKVVIDLVAEFVFDFLFEVVGIGDREVVINEALTFEKLAVVFEEFDDTFVGAADLVPVDARGWFEGG